MQNYLEIFSVLLQFLTIQQQENRQFGIQSHSLGLRLHFLLLYPFLLHL